MKERTKNIIFYGLTILGVLLIIGAVALYFILGAEVTISGQLTIDLCPSLTENGSETAAWTVTTSANEKFYLINETGNFIKLYDAGILDMMNQMVTVRGHIKTVQGYRSDCPTCPIEVKLLKVIEIARMR